MWIIGIIVVIVIFYFVIKVKTNKKTATTNGETTQKIAETNENIVQKENDENKFNPLGKELEWFCSEDGLKTFDEYMTAKNYLLEESIKKEKEEKYNEYDLDIVVSAFHKEAKIPYIFFKNFLDNIKAQVLDYVGPTDLMISLLSLQAKPFYIDDEGEPQPKDRYFTPQEIVSVEKNAILNYLANFKCFNLGDDDQGTFQDKWNMWRNIIFWISSMSLSDKDLISNNPWIFSQDTYLNELGTARKLKGFYKKCIEKVFSEKDKKYFEDKLKECK